MDLGTVSTCTWVQVLEPFTQVPVSPFPIRGDGLRSQRFLDGPGGHTHTHATAGDISSALSSGISLTSTGDREVAGAGLAAPPTANIKSDHEDQDFGPFRVDRCIDRGRGVGRISNVGGNAGLTLRAWTVYRSRRTNIRRGIAGTARATFAPA